MLKIFICEDDDRQRTQITDCVRKFLLMEDLDAQIALSDTDPDALLRHQSRYRETGLYFLDVDLRREINGIELAERLRMYDPRGFIVFVTTHGEALPLTFKYKVEALDYILKDDAGGMEAGIVSCIKNAYERFHTRSDGPQAHYVFKLTEQKRVSLPLVRILYFETSTDTPRKVVLHADDSLYEFYGKLDEIISQLDERFFRCHKSFIVNTQMIERVDGKAHALYLRGGQSCPVATRKIKELTARM